ncbi:hypothetical protein [Streptomyces cinerochromogenes]|uniref:hypothetical protein n=1 Tax=Streptomyces cinerochromogenes TaxID=66422 RepID=UPI0016710D4B|nr:hypothetical protein [Streptomyces cinerochromogenes]GGS45497.1 hypothetical protein GCM10010206_03940 [Streptomyces cinerochromogenes]
MTAEHEGARGAGSAGGHGGRGEYDGMDALMAAITGDPLPEEARRDPAFLAEHRAAEADVAVLRDQLSRLADALTGAEDTGAEDTGAEDTGAEDTGVEDAGEERTKQEEAGQGENGDGKTGGEGSGVSRVAVPGPRPAGRPRGRTRPAGRDRPPRPPRPGRPGGPRRALRIVLGSFAGATAFSLALGFGWLVTHGGGGDDMGGASSGAEKQNAGAGVRPPDPERELACSRLVVEGTVARVEPAQDAAGSRVTLTVTRSYKPAHGPAEVAFLLDAGAWPAPRRGQHALVRVPHGDTYASQWTVGDVRVAAERDWITDALPGSRTTLCPSGDAS